jgi:hypothetical protein
MLAWCAICGSASMEVVATPPAFGQIEPSLSTKTRMWVVLCPSSSIVLCIVTQKQNIKSAYYGIRQFSKVQMFSYGHLQLQEVYTGIIEVQYTMCTPMIYLDMLVPQLLHSVTIPLKWHLVQLFLSHLKNHVFICL